jgi:hypothetical protein
MIRKEVNTFWVRLYLSGPIDVAKQILRQECLVEGLCVTIERTTYIYTGGEEAGYVVGLVNYPRFPSTPDQLVARGRDLADKLRVGTYQQSSLLQTPVFTEWTTTREGA